MVIIQRSSVETTPKQIIQIDIHFKNGTPS